MSRGYPLNKITSNSFKIPGYGGLYIHSRGLKWNRFSGDIGGGTIQFVMHMENKSWVAAVKELLDMPVDQYAYSLKEHQKSREYEAEKKPFKLPEKNESFKHIFAYLIGTRKIDKQIVYELVKLKKIYENKYNGCVFVGYDNYGEAKYAAIRGTNPSTQYRKDVAGADKSYPFAINVKDTNVCTNSTFKSNSLFVFESPIDMMSYLSLLKLYRIKEFDAHCISLGGVCDLALERFLEENSHITEITLGLDSDEAGRLACEQVRQKYLERYDIRRHLPKGKDFNEELVSLSTSILKEQSKATIENTEYQAKVSEYNEMLFYQ